MYVCGNDNNNNSSNNHNHNNNTTTNNNNNNDTGNSSHLALQLLHALALLGELHLHKYYIQYCAYSV